MTSNFEIRKAMTLKGLRRGQLVDNALASVDHRNEHRHHESATTEKVETTNKLPT